MACCGRSRATNPVNVVNGGATVAHSPKRAIQIEYTASGDGPEEVIGASGTRYGMRSTGDRFYVYFADIEAARARFKEVR